MFGGLLLRGEIFLYVFFGIRDCELSRVCNEEMSNRTNGFDVPPGFKLKD